MKKKYPIISFLLVGCILLFTNQEQLNIYLEDFDFSALIESVYNEEIEVEEYEYNNLDTQADVDILENVDDEKYVELNNNIPEFSEEELNSLEDEVYFELDYLERPTGAFAIVSESTFPTDDRESISSVYPPGYVQSQYDIVSGTYLYNRCHLIGFQLTGENANENNLITCTRQANNDAMLIYENEIVDYIEETNNSVAYRVIPIYEDDNLVASAINMQAYSIEDDGEGLSFNIYVFNTQYGIEIDYATGESNLIEE